MRPEQRLGAEHGKEAGLRAEHVNALRPFAAGQRESAALRDGHLVEGVVLVLNVDVLAGRGPVAENADCRRMQPDGRQPVGMRIGKRTQQQRVDHAENGGIGADADGQGGHDDQRQHHVLAKHAKGVAKILEPEAHEILPGWRFNDRTGPGVEANNTDLKRDYR